MGLAIVADTQPDTSTTWESPCRKEAAVDIRCENKKHGELTDDGLVEVKCSSRFCGAAPGVVVLHTFDAQTGKLVQTRVFRNVRRPQ